MPVQVLLTVDTEIWPAMSDWPHQPLARNDRCEWEARVYFNGETADGLFGLPYQLAMLRDRGLKATYFIEPLFSFALGIEPLREIVSAVTDHGQEVGLHLHPEWLTDERCEGLPAFCGPLLSDYSPDAQDKLIKAGLARLREAGADEVNVFRGGSWGANQATLAALERNGVRMDSSLNAAFPQSIPDMPARLTLQHPMVCGNVIEIPVTCFLDGSPRGIRPLHVTACSFEEFRHVVESSIDREPSVLVVVWHSFEFVRVSRLARGHPVSPQRLIIRRFEHMCDYLAAHRNVVETCHFRDVSPDVGAAHPSGLIGSSRARTVARMAEQLLSRIY